MFKVLLPFLIVLCAFSQEKSISKEEIEDRVNQELDKRLKKVNGENLIEFSKQLLKKEKEIALKELEIQKKEQSLKMSLKDFRKKLRSFEIRQSKFLACLDSVKDKENKRISHLVSIISGMRPKNAADQLSVQDADIAVKVLGMLDPVKVSKIFNLMDKEISARLQKQFLTMEK